MEGLNKLGNTTIENWLDDDTLNYYKALTILAEWEKFKKVNKN